MDVSTKSRQLGAASSNFPFTNENLVAAPELIVHPTTDADPGVVIRGSPGQFLALWTA